MNKMLKFILAFILLADVVFLGYASKVYNTPEQPKYQNIQKIQQIEQPKREVKNTEKNEEQLIDNQIVRATIRIASAFGHGTGVVFYQDNKIAYIITAYHVVEKSDTLLGEYQEDNKIILENLKLEKKDEIHDMAILSSKPKWKSTVNLIKSPKDICKYVPTFTFGFVTGPEYGGIFSTGNLTSMNNTSFLPIEKMVTTTPVVFGNSGGGMFIKYNGNYTLIGVLTNMHIAMHGDHLIYIYYIDLCSTPTQMLDLIDEFMGSIKSNK